MERFLSIYISAGTELLQRKWTKQDEIEYDSDPRHTQMDGKSHVHKARILNVNRSSHGHGKLMVKDDTGGYANHPLEHIKVKLAPRNQHNALEQEEPKEEKVDALSSLPVRRSHPQGIGLGDITLDGDFDLELDLGFDDDLHLEGTNRNKKRKRADSLDLEFGFELSDDALPRNKRRKLNETDNDDECDSEQENTNNSNSNRRQSDEALPGTDREQKTQQEAEQPEAEAKADPEHDPRWTTKRVGSIEIEFKQNSSCSFKPLNNFETSEFGELRWSTRKLGYNQREAKLLGFTPNHDLDREALNTLWADHLSGELASMDLPALQREYKYKRKQRSKLSWRRQRKEKAAVKPNTVCPSRCVCVCVFSG